MRYTGIVGPRRLEERVSASIVDNRTHFLVRDGSRFSIVKLHTLPTGDHHILMVAKLWLARSQYPDTSGVFEAAAVHGVGPIMYDAVMETIYPRGLVPGNPSKAALAVWQYYLGRRPDVEKTPLPGAPAGSEDPRHFSYRKRPGYLAGKVLDMHEFLAEPAVVDWLGAERASKLNSVETDAYDATPRVPGSWDEAIERPKPRTLVAETPGVLNSGMRYTAIVEDVARDPKAVEAGLRQYLKSIQKAAASADPADEEDVLRMFRAMMTSIGAAQNLMTPGSGEKVLALAGVPRK